MPKEPRYVRKQAAIREMLSTIGHNAVLRSEPQPSVFLDHEPEARFYAPSWPTVYDLVFSYVTKQSKSLAS